MIRPFSPSVRATDLRGVYQDEIERRKHASKYKLLFPITVADDCQEWQARDGVKAASV